MTPKNTSPCLQKSCTIAENLQIQEQDSETISDKTAMAALIKTNLTKK